MSRFNFISAVTTTWQFSLAVPLLVLLSACQTTTPTSGTLKEIDRVEGTQKQSKVFVAPKSKQEIRDAYIAYLESATLNDRSRINALSRLAELEYKDSNRLLKDIKQKDDSEQEQRYQQRLNRTIELLTTSIRDYPEAKNNDALLYQLAKAQAQNEQHEDSIESLNKLVEKYPNSEFYVEAQFRIAEDAFSVQDYSSAEYAYSEVIISPLNKIYFEKSLFKRGWARFKQQYYNEAVDDFLQATLHHDFEAFEKLSTSERDQFDEYFRAIGLSFSYLGGAEPLYQYFKNRPDFIYTYHTYSMVAELYLKQERYSDAVETHEQFIQHFPDSENIPYSYLKIIEIWKNSGFTQKIYQAVESFYVKYNPSSVYWKNQNENSSINRVIRRSLKEYLVLMTEYYHNRYQRSLKTVDYQRAEKWYQRYFKHYEAYAQQDRIYFAYAELLAQKNKTRQALKYYELAAFDNELLIHKEAAYAALSVSNEILENKNTFSRDLLDRHLNYATQYAQKYSAEKRTQAIAVNAMEKAHNAKQYKTSIELADLALGSPYSVKQNYVQSIKAASYFELKEYQEAEKLYGQLLKNKNLKTKQRKQFNNRLALSIYKQGESAQSQQNITQAITDFARISTLAPRTDIAATGLYDAIALNIKHKQWKPAITQIKHFQSLYASHKLSTDVSKKLSVAYLSSNQGIKAAREFEKISSMSQDKSLQSTALWQAAELYEQENKIKDAIRSYQDFAKKYKKPYEQNLEALQKLTELNNKQGKTKQQKNWLKKITQADKKALNNVKTDRTNFIASSAYLQLARLEKNHFDKMKLTLPLKRSLRRKKTAMQNAVRLYGQASMNKIYPIATESTWAIALIYKDFSQALLNSDRPTTLNEDELDQYEILLEDQAFPFEDKAIEFFEINLSRVKDGLFNEWIGKSHEELISLFPVRYDRKPKVDRYADQLM